MAGADRQHSIGGGEAEDLVDEFAALHPGRRRQFLYPLDLGTAEAQSGAGDATGARGRSDGVCCVDEDERRQRGDSVHTYGVRGCTGVDETSASASAQWPIPGETPPSSPSPPRRPPRGTVTLLHVVVLDAPPGWHPPRIPFAAMVVPRGMESDWMYTEAGGQWQLLGSCLAARLLLVSRGHPPPETSGDGENQESYPGRTCGVLNWQDAEVGARYGTTHSNENSDGAGLSDDVLKPLLRNLILSVAPVESLCQKGGPSIPFLAFEDNVLWRDTVETLTSAVTGGILVEDVVLDLDFFEGPKDPPSQPPSHDSTVTNNDVCDCAPGIVPSALPAFSNHPSPDDGEQGAGPTGPRGRGEHAEQGGTKGVEPCTCPCHIPWSSTMAPPATSATAGGRCASAWQRGLRSLTKRGQALSGHGGADASAVHRRRTALRRRLRFQRSPNLVQSEVPLAIKGSGNHTTIGLEGVKAKGSEVPLTIKGSDAGSHKAQGSEVPLAIKGSDGSHKTQGSEVHLAVSGSDAGSHKAEGSEVLLAIKGSRSHTIAGSKVPLAIKGSEGHDVKGSEVPLAIGGALQGRDKGMHSIPRCCRVPQYSELVHKYLPPIVAGFPLISTLLSSRLSASTASHGIQRDAERLRGIQGDSRELRGVRGDVGDIRGIQGDSGESIPGTRGLSDAPRMVVLGGGACTLPIFLRRNFPHAIHVVELDPALIDVSRKYFDLVEDERLVCHCGDALEFVRSMAREADAWATGTARANVAQNDVTPGTSAHNDVTPSTGGGVGGSEDKRGKRRRKGVTFVEAPAADLRKDANSGCTAVGPPAGDLRACAEKAGVDRRCTRIENPAAAGHVRADVNPGRSGLGLSEGDPRADVSPGCANLGVPRGDPRPDVIVLDIDARETDGDLSAPPAEFVQDDILSLYKRGLHPMGMLAMNVVPCSESGLASLVSKLEGTFAEVYCSKVEDDVNAVLYCLVEPAGMQHVDRVSQALETLVPLELMQNVDRV